VCSTNANPTCRTIKTTNVKSSNPTKSAMTIQHKIWLDRMVALEQNLDQIQDQIEQMHVSESWTLEDSQQAIQAIQAIRRQWLRANANREAIQKLRTLVPIHLLSKPTAFRVYLNTIEHWMNELEEGENT
jgi:hypothetical protein